MVGEGQVRQGSVGQFCGTKDVVPERILWSDNHEPFLCTTYTINCLLFNVEI